MYSHTLAKHVEHLETVLGELQRHSLYANMKKCLFAQPQIKYLGHVVLADGVAVDQSKVAAMLEWLIPTTLKQLWGFLGLTIYYRKFVKGYGTIAWPLIEQLKKDNFQ